MQGRDAVLHYGINSHRLKHDGDLWMLMTILRGNAFCTQQGVKKVG